MSKNQSRERRAHPRHDATLDIQGTPSDGGVVARMVARNLSLGGLYCTSATDFPEMTRLAVRLLLPLKGASDGNPEPVELEAVVVRCEELEAAQATQNQRYQLGLFFTNVDGSSRDQIERFLDHRSN